MYPFNPTGVSAEGCSMSNNATKPIDEGQQVRRLSRPMRTPGGALPRKAAAGAAQPASLAAARRPASSAKEDGGTPLAALCAKALRFPFLAADKEGELIRAWRDHEDKSALNDLIGSHLRLVIKIARRFRGYGLPMADLIAEGNIGLMQAARRFDPERAVRFATYATWWIRAAIQEYILRSASIVRIGTTTAQRKLFFNLRRLKAEAGWQGQGDLQPELVRSIAAELDLREDDVIEMDRRLSRADSSLNARPAGQESGEWLEMLSDEQPDQETSMGEAEELAERRHLLGEAMSKLDEREHEIIVLRQLSEAPPSLAELGERFGVSGERVRQVEKRALTKLGKFVRAAAQTLDRPTAMAAT